MQVKFFTIPIVGGEKISEELNVFLRSNKVLETEGIEPLSDVYSEAFKTKA